MKLIKSYTLFNKLNESIEYDFLVAVGNMKRAIIKIVEVFEKHHHSDNKISTDVDFQSALKSIIDDNLKSRYHITDSYIDIIYRFEEKLYSDNKIENSESSLMNIFDELIKSFISAIRYRNEDNVYKLDVQSSNIIRDIDDSWVNSHIDISIDIDNKEVDAELDDELEEDFEIFDRWETSEGLQADLEKYIGKELGEFEYSDKLKAFNYVESNPIIKMILEEGEGENLEKVKVFLSSLKEFFGL